MNFSPIKNILDMLSETLVPGNSIAISLDGKEVFSCQSGFCDLESKEKMTQDKLFNIYSCTKPITVSAALMLYEKGLFGLDDPLYEYIPEYKTMYLQNGEKATTHITLRHLFTMTSGLTYNSDTAAFKKAKELTGGKMNTLSVIKCLAEDALAFNPGEKWNYSLSHDVLAAVCEVITGKKFSDYVRESIFLPLGMNDSYFHNENVRDRMASQYILRTTDTFDIVKMQAGAKGGKKIEKLTKDVSLVFGTEYDSGGAGITTTVSDYLRFSAALSCGGIYGGERILAPATVALMKENQLTKSQAEAFNWTHLSGYGYGLGVRTLLSDSLSASLGNAREFGWGGAAGASVYIDTENRLSCFYAHHMLNPQEHYYQPLVRKALYECLN